MSQTAFIVLIVLFLAAVILLFWWMTRSPADTASPTQGAQEDGGTAEALASLVPDEEGDTSPPQTVAGESIALDPVHPADLDRRVDAPPARPVDVAPPAPPPAPPVAAAPVTAVPAGDADSPDDLLLLKGVGPKLAARLGQLGVTRFDQIAGWTDADIDRIDAELGTFKGRIRRDNWVDQAGYLARGDRAGFAAKYGNI